jgi:hypothetical protein
VSDSAGAWLAQVEAAAADEAFWAQQARAQKKAAADRCSRDAYWHRWMDQAARQLRDDLAAQAPVPRPETLTGLLRYLERVDPTAYRVGRSDMTPAEAVAWAMRKVFTEYGDALPGYGLALTLRRRCAHLVSSGHPLFTRERVDEMIRDAAAVN